MIRIKFFSMLLLCGVIATFTSCMKDEELDGVNKMRSAKAEYYSAEAKLRLADAEHRNAQAEFERMRAKNQELQNKTLELNNELLASQNSEAIAGHKAAIEIIAEQLKVDLVNLQASKAKADAAYQQALKEYQLALIGINEKYYTEYSKIMGEINTNREDYRTNFDDMTNKQLTLLKAVSLIDSVNIKALLNHDVKKAQRVLETLEKQKVALEKAVEVKPGDNQAGMDEAYAEIEKVVADYNAAVKVKLNLNVEKAQADDAVTAKTAELKGARIALYNTRQNKSFEVGTDVAYKVINNLKAYGILSVGDGFIEKNKYNDPKYEYLETYRFLKDFALVVDKPNPIVDKYNQSTSQLLKDKLVNVKDAILATYRADWQVVVNVQELQATNGGGIFPDATYYNKAVSDATLKVRKDNLVVSEKNYQDQLQAWRKAYVDLDAVMKAYKTSPKANLNQREYATEVFNNEINGQIVGSMNDADFKKYAPILKAAAGARFAIDGWAFADPQNGQKPMFNNTTTGQGLNKDNIVGYWMDVLGYNDNFRIEGSAEWGTNIKYENYAYGTYILASTATFGTAKSYLQAFKPKDEPNVELDYLSTVNPNTLGGAYKQYYIDWTNVRRIVELKEFTAFYNATIAEITALEETLVVWQAKDEEDEIALQPLKDNVAEVETKIDDIVLDWGPANKYAVLTIKPDTKEILCEDDVTITGTKGRYFGLLQAIYDAFNNENIAFEDRLNRWLDELESKEKDIITQKAEVVKCQKLVVAFENALGEDKVGTSGMNGFMKHWIQEKESEIENLKDKLTKLDAELEILNKRKDAIVALVEESLK